MTDPLNIADYVDDQGYLHIKPAKLTELLLDFSEYKSAESVDAATGTSVVPQSYVQHVMEKAREQCAAFIASSECYNMTRAQMAFALRELDLIE